MSVPMKEARVRRWEVAVAFIALAASFVLAVVAIQHANSVAHKQEQERITAVAQLTRQIQATAQRTRALRIRQIRTLHLGAVRSCRSRHALAHVLIKLLTQSIKDSEGTPIPGDSAAQQAAFDHRIQQGIDSARNGLVLVRKADCLHVEPLPKPRPHGR